MWWGVGADFLFSAKSIFNPLFKGIFWENKKDMKKFKKEYELKDIIPLLSEDSLKVASGMIEDALFMQEQLALLRETIKKEGVSENYQYGSKQTAAMTSYLQIQKQYGVIIKYLTELIPKESKNSASANLLDWVNNN